MCEFDLHETLMHTMIDVGETPIRVRAEDGDIEFKWSGDRFEVINHPWSPDGDQPPELIIALKWLLMSEEEKAIWVQMDPDGAADFQGDVCGGIEVLEAGGILSMPISESFWGTVHYQCHTLMECSSR
ncbi:hypothetical protein [Paramagnetospirillum magneticum]|uniref:hypothetical protein n=1 Tax=Paramagnetospirillum magneticum TaxID=84159 RepID=UPI0005C1B33E|nr:hypothetical protein [Paramagnetospirillum magneticum]